MEKVYWKIDYIIDECLICEKNNKVKGDGTELDEQSEFGHITLIYRCWNCGSETVKQIDLEQHSIPM